MYCFVTCQHSDDEIGSFTTKAKVIMLKKYEECAQKGLLFGRASKKHAVKSMYIKN